MDLVLAFLVYAFVAFHDRANNPHSFNRYTYVKSNPYKCIEPDGEFPLENWVSYRHAEINRH